MHWLLLKGLGRERGHWGRFPEVLEAQFPGRRVLTLDLPGAGTEHRCRSPASIHGIVQDVRDRFLVARSEADGPWGVLAISLGGMVAMEWCARFPHDFARVVLVNTSARDLSPPWKRMRLGVVWGVVRAILGRDAVAREALVLSLTTRMQADLQPVARHHARCTAERPMDRGSLLRQLWAGTRFRAPGSLVPPALLVSSARDGFTHPDCPAALARRFSAPLRVHDHAGHDLPLDDPDWLATTVRVWTASAVGALPAPDGAGRIEGPAGGVARPAGPAG